MLSGTGYMRTLSNRIHRHGVAKPPKVPRSVSNHSHRNNPSTIFEEIRYEIHLYTETNVI